MLWWSLPPDASARRQRCVAISRQTQEEGVVVAVVCRGPLFAPGSLPKQLSELYLGCTEQIGTFRFSPGVVMATCVVASAAVDDRGHPMLMCSFCPGIESARTSVWSKDMSDLLGKYSQAVLPWANK